MGDGINEQDIKDFLLKTEFKIESGFSYSELLGYLNNFKYLYRETFEEKRKLRRELELKENVISKIIDEIEHTEYNLAHKNKQVSNLYARLNKKLTIKERLKGKIIL